MLSEEIKEIINEKVTAENLKEFRKEAYSVFSEHISTSSETNTLSKVSIGVLGNGLYAVCKNNCIIPCNNAVEAVEKYKSILNM